MYIQDLTSPGTNVAAEISKEQANNFIQMCNIFASNRSHERCIDDYVTKLMQIHTSRATVNNVSSPKTALENLKSAVAAVKTPSGITNTAIAKVSCTTSTNNPIPTHKLTELIDVQRIAQTIPSIAVGLAHHTAQRRSAEVEIQTLLKRHLKEFHSSFDVLSFGSTAYGKFGGSHTDFNILVTAGSDQKPYETIQCIVTLFHTPHIQKDFKVISTISGDRVQKRRLQVVHIASGILCTIQFDSGHELAESSQIIRNCILHAPICK